MRNCLLLGAAVILLAGCNGAPFSHEWKFGPDKISPGFALGKKSTGKGVYTWPSSAVGAFAFAFAFAFAGDRACLQSAATANAKSGSFAATLMALDKVDATLARQYAQTVVSLQDKNDVATFADVSLFHICMMAANGTLENSDVAKSITEVIQASKHIAEKRTNPTDKRALAASNVGVIESPAATNAAPDTVITGASVLSETIPTGAIATVLAPSG